MRKSLIIFIVALVFLGAGFFVFVSKDSDKNKSLGYSNTNTTSNISSVNVNSQNSAATVSWEFNGSTWSSTGTPPACPDPLVLETPVDLQLATSVLYPGQIRGGDYKAHGGFRFDNAVNSDIAVTAPLDAKLVQGSRYIEQGEIQYLLSFQHPCGISYSFDHLHTLSPELRKLADTLPEAKVDDSRTTRFENPIQVQTGDVIATAVGFVGTKNVTVDFGLYDLRKKNASSADATWASNHSVQTAQYAVCWFDYLNVVDEATVRGLAAADRITGATSDYCK